jgi:long-chain fatty acid transport protein
MIPGFCRRLLLGVALTMTAVSTARATDGHLLHGVGAINSAIGGVGVASSTSILGAFYVNPAGLARFGATRFELGFEMFKPSRTISSTAGPASGSTTSSSQFVPVPAFAWSSPVRDSTVVIGLAGIGAGGFGVDYPLDPTNPILAPRPYGFGQVFSSFQLMKIVPAVAMKASALRLGFAVNADWASLAVDPMPTAAPAVDPGPDGVPNTPDDRAYYSRATDASGSFGIGFQAGLQYDVLGDFVSVGLSYVSPQRFQSFEFSGVYENPNLASFNTPRTISFAMDSPAIYGAGVAIHAMDSFFWGFDAKYVTYAQTRGFKESGFAADGAVQGFGWENIWTLSTGLEFQPASRVVTRLGYNHSGNPIPDALSMFNAPAPAVVQHHATLGLGYRFEGGFGVDVAYYHAFENSIAGPMQTPAGPMPGTQVRSSLSENSILMGFSYAPGAAKK